MSKPKIGLYWLAGCGGCEESVVDMAERIIDVAAAVDIVFWPVAVDFKRSDVEALADGELAVALLNGAVRLDEQAHMAKLLRRKSKLIVAQGACACSGGVVGLANLWDAETTFDTVYRKAVTLADPKPTADGAGTLPHHGHRHGADTLALPTMLDRVYALDQVIDVDYYLPGCPPTADMVYAAVQAVVSGQLPPKGAALAGSVALCDSCPRRDSKPLRLELTGFKRVHQTHLDSSLCLIAQGIPCLGPATRDGCRARCISANMPCSGCFGPLDRVMEQGAKAASMLAGCVDVREPEQVEAFVDAIADPLGLVYRYGLAGSVLKGENGRELKRTLGASSSTPSRDSRGTVASTSCSTRAERWTPRTSPSPSFAGSSSSAWGARSRRCRR